MALENIPSRLLNEQQEMLKRQGQEIKALADQYYKEFETNGVSQQQSNEYIRQKAALEKQHSIEKERVYADHKQKEAQYIADLNAQKMAGDYYGQEHIREQVGLNDANARLEEEEREAAEQAVQNQKGFLKKAVDKVTESISDGIEKVKNLTNPDAKAQQEKQDYIKRLEEDQRKREQEKEKKKNRGH